MLMKLFCRLSAAVVRIHGPADRLQPKATENRVDEGHSLLNEKGTIDKEAKTCLQQLSQGLPDSSANRKETEANLHRSQGLGASAIALAGDQRHLSPLLVGRVW